MKPFVAAVDWGTSSFRLWLVDRDGGVIAEARGDEGMVKAREEGFGAVLDRYMKRVGAPGDLPVIICGMAGARQGWREAPYLDAPASLDALAGAAIAVGGGGRDIRILPGICQRDPQWPDVMRGEETQLLGAREGGLEAGIVCMPGTHSKWVALDGGRVERFRTFMTGDVHAALARHSILRFAVEGQPAAAPGDGAFIDAVREAVERPDLVLAGLFRIRAGGLLDLAEAAAAPARLSGLLIGGEIGAARLQLGGFEHTTLVGGGMLGELYAAALRAAGMPFAIVDADEAVRAGLVAAARRILGGMR